MKWKRLYRCPTLPLKRAIVKGHWTQADVEIFGEEEETHIHFYTESLEKARKIYTDIKHLIPNTIKTFSIMGEYLFFDIVLISKSIHFLEEQNGVEVSPGKWEGIGHLKGRKIKWVASVSPSGREDYPFRIEILNEEEV